MKTYVKLNEMKHESNQIKSNKIKLNISNKIKSNQIGLCYMKLDLRKKSELVKIHLSVLRTFEKVKRISNCCWSGIVTLNDHFS